VYTRLTDPLPDDAVVLATPEAGWPLPTVKGKVISVYHENPLLQDQAARYVATAQFFSTPMTEIERAELIRKYEPGYLLLEGDAETEELQRWLVMHGQQVAGIGNFRMYRLQATADDAEQPAALVQEELVETSNPWPTPQTAPVTEPPPELSFEDAESAEVEESIESDSDMPDEEGSQPPAYGAPIAEPVVN
jgi:hypothetical protein